MDLAAAYRSGELLRTGEICRRHAIPERYLEQMLTSLRKAGLLKSIRGPRGGFQLLRSPESITVAEVEACLEGESRSERRGDREAAEFVVINNLDQRLEAARHAVLAATTLEELQQQRDSLRLPQPMFYI
jgi:Rrf2 family transcriptional regulator, cysteine metabolism repressor